MKTGFFDKGRPFVLFKLPGKDSYYSLQQQDEKVHTVSHFNESGFYLGPFDFSRHPVLFIPLARSVFKQHKIPHAVRDYIKGCRIKKIPDPDGHRKKVKQAVSLIENNDSLSKLVISAPFDLHFDFLDMENFFYAIARAYPGAFVYVWHHPRAGFAMAGASPEPLLSFSKLGLTEVMNGATVSLAGTKFTDENKNWTDKERIEQQIVTDYIKRKLFELRLAVTVSAPYDYRQGQLVHLRTDISFLFPEGNLIDEILKSLHPTPAVAGMPKEKAVEYIAEIEGYDREYYTGFFGFRQADRGLFHVNLRSVKICNKSLRIYAGGGIVRDSNPEAEWNEVLRKTDVMKSLLCK